MGIIEWYQMLFRRCSSPRVSDCTRVTIYTFEKNCKACGAGMMKPERHHPRVKKALFKSSYCSDKCKVEGPRRGHMVAKSVKPTVSNQKSTVSLDDLVTASKALEEFEKRVPPFARAIKVVDERYKLLSEKLSFMEFITGERWTKSKFYFWKNRIGI